jgi:outer membrane protein assembly factor BamB
MWRRAASGVVVPPAVDGDRMLLGAQDGKLIALAVKDGAPIWDRFAGGGVTALGAARGLVYVGAGDKHLYCLDERDGAQEWPARIGSLVVGRISIDEDRIYFSALDNVIRAYDRNTGNQRWTHQLRERATAGVIAVGEVVFVPVTSSQLVMLYAKDGKPAGTIGLPGNMTPDSPPSVTATPDGLHVFAITGGLANEWQLTGLGPAGDPPVEMGWTAELPGPLYLSDPALVPLAVLAPSLVMGDPELMPLTALEWPVVLTDPRLMPLTELPGIQLRPLSPTLPVRRGTTGPGGAPLLQSAPA